MVSDSFKSVLNLVLKKVIPKATEVKIINALINKLLEISNEFGKESIEPMICGSTIKGTWLSKRRDIDLFLLFDENETRETLEKKGLDIAKKVTKKMKGTWKIAYSEHPYLKSKINVKGQEYDIDIVPCFNVNDSSKIKSAVDRTPYHVKFVNKALKKNLRNDVRLLKQFCKANKCYGADLRVQGFSGYLCELLIIKYGGFLKTVKNISKWRSDTYISLTNSSKKFRTSLTFIDPVDPNRNVASAVSNKTFFRFIKACKLFLENPSEKFFEVGKGKVYSTKKIMNIIDKRKTEWFLIKFKTPKILEDVLWSQMRRGLKSFNRLLNENGFKVTKKDCWAGENCIFVFEMDVWKVPRIYKHIGPVTYSKQVKGFLKRYKKNKVYIEGDKWVVERKRKYTNVYDLFKDILKNKKKMKLEGIPKKLIDNLSKSKIIKERSIPIFLKTTSRNFKVFLRDYFEEDLNIF